MCRRPGRVFYYSFVIFAVFAVEMILWSYVNLVSVRRFLAPYSKNPLAAHGVLFLTVNFTWVATVLLIHRVKLRFFPRSKIPEAEIDTTIVTDLIRIDPPPITRTSPAMARFDDDDAARAMSPVKGGRVYTAYARSLIWVALLIAVVIGVSTVVELIFVDFVHGNPDGTKANTLLMVALFAPMLGFIAGFIVIIGSFLVFTLPQCFQAVTADVLMRCLGHRGEFGVLIVLPITAALAWYCYGHLTPMDFILSINEGPDWTPHEHSLTLQRYLTMLVVQTPVTIFSLAYCDTAIQHRSRKRLILMALALAVVVGVVRGLWMAHGRYQFL